MLTATAPKTVATDASTTLNGDWLVCDRDGTLCAYVPRDGAVVCLTEDRTHAGGWQPPRRIGGDARLLADLAVGQGRDRYVHLVSLRECGAKGQVELVHSVHFQSRLAALDWTSLGHPNKNRPRTGTPAVTVDAQGRAHVFVRNEFGGLSMRAQRERGGWEPWRDLKGKHLEEELVAVTTAAGLVEVYAPVLGGILRWRQTEPGGVPVLEGLLPARVRPGTLRAMATSEDSVTLFFTDLEGTLVAWRPDLNPEPVPVVAAAGDGRAAAVRCVLEGYDCTLFAQQSVTGRTAMAAYPTEVESAGAWWAESGPQLPDTLRVALCADARGRLVVGALSQAEGVLRTVRQKAEPGLAFGAWDKASLVTGALGPAR
ncbi:hypothetical protein [Streptomyces sp. NBC_01304]|uniref:hypothetical protein n=1 Tax=Streptomyces sp. NBC_01304 TaxID=2903818 RepID=UPI002E0ECD55|nr:hypothetical protein OG430_13120 [Streptomyces sp. NBC_01304]